MFMCQKTQVPPTSTWFPNAEDSDDEDEKDQTYKPTFAELADCENYDPLKDKSIPRTTFGVCFLDITNWKSRQLPKVRTKRRKRKRKYKKDSRNTKRRKLSTVSEFRGVVWDGRNRKWRAQLSHKGVKHYLGLYSCEEEAAQAVNYKCDEMGFDRYNPELGAILPRYKPKGKKRSRKKAPKRSIYRGVVWDEQANKWKAEFVSCKRPHFLGHFDDEKTAALVVNKECDKLKIARKNRNLEPEETESATENVDPNRLVQQATPNKSIKAKTKKVSGKRQTKRAAKPLLESGKFVN